MLCLFENLQKYILYGLIKRVKQKLKVKNETLRDFCAENRITAQKMYILKLHFLCHIQKSHCIYVNLNSHIEKVSIDNICRKHFRWSEFQQLISLTEVNKTQLRKIS